MIVIKPGPFSTCKASRAAGETLEDGVDEQAPEHLWITSAYAQTGHRALPTRGRAIQGGYRIFRHR